MEQLPLQSKDTFEQEQRPPVHASIWVLIGFMLWIGFFIGAVILHAMVK